MTQSQTFKDSHKQEKVFLCTELREVQSHTYTTMTVTKTNVTISLTQPNDVLLDCQAFRLPFLDGMAILWLLIILK